MRLAELVTSLQATTGEGLDVVGGESSDPDIVDVEHDSRVAATGSLFACIRGARTDGHLHAAEAVAAGAVALLVDHAVETAVPQVVVPDVRRMVGPAASEVHGRPSERLALIGITGTNGKTTTVRLVCDLLRATGRGVAEIGTLTGVLTTPEATQLQRRFVDALADGDDHVAMEVSSHALSQHRVDGSRFRIAAFTNLGRDHLDHHGTVEAYFAAKARLFDPGLSETAVIDVGTPHGRLLADTAEIPVISVDSTDVELVCVRPDASRFLWREHVVRLPLGGRFNVANALLAAEIVTTLGVPEAEVAEAMGSVEPVPGRFEPIDEGQDFAVLVDFAHTPDALESVLTAARDVAEGRLVVVFGAGGDRDREKRPRMGSIARELADLVLVTSDNPRGEDPHTIISAIISGMSRDADIVEPDRRMAIRRAVEVAAGGDVVVIAGKGHETTQTTGDRIEAFDDREVVRAELRRLRGGEK